MKSGSLGKRIASFLLALFLLFAGLCPLPIRVRSLSIMLPICSYDEYLEFIAQENIPEHYVLYTHIQALGSFQRYCKNSPYTASYFILDENEQQLAFHTIDKSLPSSAKSHLTVPLFAADMRKLDAQKSGIVIRGPLRYCYEMGTLICIRWHLGNTEFSLGIEGAPYLGGYPQDGETTVSSRLLSRNYLSALFAYYDIIKYIPTQPGETVISRIWPVISFIVSILLIPVCLIAVCVFQWRHKQKNSNKTPSRNRQAHSKC